MIWSALLIASSLLIILLYYLRNDDIPGPKRIPLLGNIQLFLTKPSKFMYLIDYYKNIYGDIFVMYMFNTRTLFLSHPKYIKPLLSSTELITKGKPYEILGELFGDGLATNKGSKWKKQRKFLSPAFNYNILQQAVPSLLKNNKPLIKTLEKYADGAPFDLFPINALTALDNVADFVMGIDVGAQTNAQSDYVKSVEYLAKILAYRIQNPIAGNNFLFKFMSVKKLYDESLKYIDDTTKQVIRKRVKELANTECYDSTIHRTLLDLMILSEMDGLKLDEEAIAEQINTFMFAGHDTTTSALSFALLCISKHEHVQNKLLEEQREVLGGKTDEELTYTDFQQMKYLERVIKESLRMYPSAPFIERFITKDINLGGRHIKKNTSIFINMLGVHRNANVYENPLEFRPERFESSNEIESSYSWMPFSAGPRNCIGWKFAMLQLKVVVFGVIQNFKLLPVDVDPHLSCEIALKSDNGTQIRLERRLK